MCTAAAYKTKDFYFGRTLDYESSYGEDIAVMPRKYKIEFSDTGKLTEHYAICGIAHIADGFPLFYDAVNEKGLAAAGLNFVGNAYYGKNIPGRDNVAQYELLVWILAQCKSVDEAVRLIENLNITDTPFNENMPAAQLHWIFADKNRAITLEATKDGVQVYDNPAGVLTNNPPFDMQLQRLNDYMSLSAKEPVNTFKIPLSAYSRGMGAIGLPGDWSSASRFVRAAFVRANSVSDDTEEKSVSQFFHILGSVEQARGCCEVGDGEYEISIYTSCCNADKGIYYYKTYDNSQISAVNMHHEDLDGTELVHYPMKKRGEIFYQN